VRACAFHVFPEVFAHVNMCVVRLRWQVPESALASVAELVKTSMETCVQLKVPLVVNLAVGRNWGDLEAVKMA
jgi:hypothetical protein